MIVLLVLSFILNIALAYICIRFIRRTFEFDDAFTQLMSQVKGHKDYLNEVNSRFLYNDTPEILQMVKNLQNMEKTYGEIYTEFIEEGGVENV